MPVVTVTLLGVLAWFAEGKSVILVFMHNNKQ